MSAKKEISRKVSSRIDKERRRLEKELATLASSANVLNGVANKTKTKILALGPTELGRIFREMLPLYNSISTYNEVLDGIYGRIARDYTKSEQKHFVSQMSAIESLVSSMDKGIRELLEVKVQFGLSDDSHSYFR